MRVSVNINDVAKEAGVHRSTVSRALTGSGPVSAENRQRVREAVTKLNYHPNTLAGALKSRKHNTWGLLSFWYFMPNSMDHYYAMVLGGLLDSASKIGFRLLLHNLVGRFDQNPDCISFCHDTQLGGVVVVAPRCDESALEELKRLPTSAVLAAFRPSDPKLNFVDLDNIKGSRMMVEHLIQQGHTRIAYIGGELKLSANARDRYEGYLQGIRKAGLSMDARLIHNESFDPDFAVATLQKLMDLAPSDRPTAIFCATDLMAVAVIEEAEQKGIAVPRDLAVAGFDNNPDAFSVNPRISTINFPFYEIGMKAGDILRSLSADPQSGPYHILLEPTIVLRESTSLRPKT